MLLITTRREWEKLGGRLRECRRLYFSHLSRPFTAINARTCGVGGTGGNNNGTRRVGDECNTTDAIASWWWSSYLHLNDQKKQNEQNKKVDRMITICCCFLVQTGLITSYIKSLFIISYVINQSLVVIRPSYFKCSAAVLIKCNRINCKQCQR